MVTGRRLFSILMAVTLSLGPPALAAPSDATAPLGQTSGKFVVVVHPDVPVESLDERALRALALGRTRYWAAGEPVQLIIEPEGSLSRDIWSEGIADMSPRQFTQFWIGATFRGRAVVAPRAVPDPASAVQLVAMLPGAIAIVPVDFVLPGVRVVDTDDEISPIFDVQPVGGEGR